MLKKFYKKLTDRFEIKQDTGLALLEFHADHEETETQTPIFPLRLTLYVLVAIVAAAIIWASVSKVDKVVIAPGKIVSTAQTVKIQPLSVSIIKKFEVEIGQTVEAGQVLVRLDPTFAQADAQRLTARKNSLLLQIARLEAELGHTDFQPFPQAEAEDQKNQMILFRGRTDEYNSRQEAYAKSMEELTATLRSSEQQYQENIKQLGIIKDLEKIYEELYNKKVQSLADLLNSRYQRASKQADVSRLENEIRERRQSVARVNAEKNAFFSKWHNDISVELVAARKEYDAVNEELTKAARVRELSVLVAPRPSVVLEFGPVSEGSVVREGEPVMTLVPLDAPLEAEVFIEPSEVGYVRIGDTCRLKLDTFPFQKHGTIAGTLRTLSDDAVRIAENREPAYKGRISFSAVTLTQVPDSMRLLPGMSLKAEIKVGTRRVITFLTYPLIRTLDESMREP